ncbi:MAG: hypothetical protein AAGG01_23190 [Planctomycetota bacterium]
MKLRAWCAAGLLTAAAGAQEASANEIAPLRGTDAIVGRAMEASFRLPAAGSGRASSSGAAVVRWDGRLVHQGDSVNGMRATARETVETWRRFGERRGYRVDLDESQRVVVISDSDRFGSFVASERVIERTLRRLDDFQGLADPRPIVLLRASNADDAFDAEFGAEALGVNNGLTVFEEYGTRRDVRSVEARLAETLVKGYLAEHQPHLSDWFADGLASLISEEVTGRALIDEEPVTARSVRIAVSARQRRAGWETLDLLRVLGVRNDFQIQEGEAMMILNLLDGDLLETLVAELGQREVPASTAKSTVEREVFMSHLGEDAMRQLQTGLVNGRM